jgi:hypothetical protein
MTAVKQLVKHNQHILLTETCTHATGRWLAEDVLIGC